MQHREAAVGAARGSRGVAARPQLGQRTLDRVLTVLQRDGHTGTLASTSDNSGRQSVAGGRLVRKT